MSSRAEWANSAQEENFLSTLRAVERTAIVKRPRVRILLLGGHEVEGRLVGLSDNYAAVSDGKYKWMVAIPEMVALGVVA